MKPPAVAVILALLLILGTNAVAVRAAGGIGVASPRQDDGQSALGPQGGPGLNVTSASPGQPVALSAGGLAADAAYSIVFSYRVSASGETFTGLVVGTLTTDGDGQGTVTFEIPVGTAPGIYVIQLVTPGATSPVDAWLVNPPTLLVVSGSCSTTSCFALVGSASVAVVGSTSAILVTYKNYSVETVTAEVFAVAHDSIGQTVNVSTASLMLQPGADGTAYTVPLGLPSGTYAVTLFATDTGGVSISTTSTVSVSL